MSDILSLQEDIKALTVASNENKDELMRSMCDIKQDILQIRNHVINVLSQENRNLRLRVQTLEERVLNVEKQVNRVEQNHRKSNLELDGIPDSVGHDALAPKIVEIVNAISAPETISIKDIEACHRLYSKRKPSPTIVKMKRNLIDMVHRNRKNLQGIDTKVGLPPGTKIFVNHNLSPNMRVIDYNARLMEKKEVIAGAWFSNASVRVKCQNGNIIKCDHERDLYDAFPSYEGFTFNSDLYDRVSNLDVEQCDDLNEYFANPSS
jgi:hypothetical protein